MGDVPRLVMVWRGVRGVMGAMGVMGVAGVGFGWVGCSIVWMRFSKECEFVPSC